MFGLFSMIFGAVKAVASVISAVVDAVVTAVKQLVRQVTMRTGSYSPMWDVFINKQINWRRALRSQEEADAERDRLAQELDDNDNNGIPDLYDSETTRPEDDFLHIKYPTIPLRENDYVRFMPRALGALPQPVLPGGKGLVRSETVNNIGQMVLVKWNALNPPGLLEAPLFEANAMDLYKLGHVSGGQLTR
jgi:hypothetical protein